MPRLTKAQLLAELQTLHNRVQELEQTLERSRKLHEIMLEAFSGALLILGENDVIVEAELAGEWQQRWQPAQLVGRPISALLPPTAYESLRPILERVRTEKRSLVFNHKGLGDDVRGTYEWRLAYDPGRGTLALIRRIESPVPPGSGHRSPEALQQLQRSNRLMRLGESIAGLAHELNQPMTAIRHYGQGCLRRLDSGTFDAGEFRHAIQQIVQQAERALQILERVRRFLRGQDVPFAPVNLNTVVHETLSLMAPEIEELGVELQLHLEPGLPDIPGDAVQLSQVLANLLRNALEALADQPRKQITIATRRLAKAVELCVSDNGPGLPAEVQSHLFEPFFTTKPEGLGLGLAISRSLVEAHGGQLLAENAPEGTCFRVRLPVPTSQPPGA